MKIPDISVILPFWNAEEYIGKSLTSILASKHKNIEVIAVDDGSTDASLAICEKIAAVDPRVKIIHKDKGGVSSARNAGIAAAVGKFIGFADADDEVGADMYGYLLEKANKHEADIAQCAVIFDYGKHSEIHFAPKRELLCGIKGKSLGKYLAYSCWSKIYRREVTKGIRFDESLNVGEDLHFNLSALSQCGGILFCPEAHYRYIQRKGSVMNTLIKNKRLEEFYKAIRKSEEVFPELNPFLRLAKFKNIAHILSVTSKENSDYCKVLFAKTRVLARKILISILFCRGLSVRKRSGILLAVLVPKVYKHLICRKKKR